jgi:hypothetical protein
VRGAYFGICCDAPGRGGSGWREAVFWAARLAAVVPGVNWVLVGAGFPVPESRAPVKLLKVARRQRLMLGKVTGPAPDRPPAAAGCAGRGGQRDVLLGILVRVRDGRGTWSKNPSFSS